MDNENYNLYFANNNNRNLSMTKLATVFTGKYFSIISSDNSYYYGYYQGNRYYIKFILIKNIVKIK